MNDTKTYDVHPALMATQAAATPTHEQEEQAPEQAPALEILQETPRHTESADPVSRNFENLRKEKARAERERDELMRRLQEMEQARPTKNNTAATDDDLAINPDDLVEGKQLVKVVKNLQNQLNQYQQQTAQLSTESMLKSSYPDFDAVVSRENIERLRDNHPELAATLAASPDLYNKGVSAYTLIKKLGIYEDPIFQQERLQAQKNATKPRALASISPQQGDTPLSRANAFANGLTPDLKKQLHREMIEAMKNN